MGLAYRLLGDGQGEACDSESPGNDGHTPLSPDAVWRIEQRTSCSGRVLSGGRWRRCTGRRR
jgi:hypothetical protein